MGRIFLYVLANNPNGTPIKEETFAGAFFEKNLIFKRITGLVHFSVSVERDFTIAFDNKFFPLICYQQKVAPERPFPIQTDIKTCSFCEH